MRRPAAEPVPTSRAPQLVRGRAGAAHPLQKKMLGSCGPSRAYRLSTSSMVPRALRCLCLARMASLTTNSFALLALLAVRAVSIWRAVLSGLGGPCPCFRLQLPERACAPSA